MQRREALRLLTIAPLATAMTLRELGQAAEDFAPTPLMPALFLGHGSPMNAIERNVFTAGWAEAGRNIPRPNAILCISAHWETRGTFVTAMEKPRTIHDFGGFPQALFDVHYPAPGSAELVQQTQQAVTAAHVNIDHTWGLDHGAWSVIMHLYPNADVPVVQLSLDRTLSPAQHYDLAAQLATLRTKGVLIIGSGNMVHNLGVLDWKNTTGGYDWAEDAHARMQTMIRNGDHAGLKNYAAQGRAFTLSIPTPEHYLPLLYTLALAGKNERVHLFNDQLTMGSIAMTSVMVGG